MKKRKHILIFFFSLIIIIIISLLLQNYIEEEEKLNINFIKSNMNKEAKHIFNNILSIMQTNLTVNNINHEVIKEGIYNYLSPYKFHITFINAVNPDNKANKLNNQAFEYFNKHKEKNYYIKYSDDFDDFYFIGALVANESCLKCHKGTKIGDILGGIKVDIPIKEYKKHYNEVKHSHKNLRSFIIVISFLLIVIISIIIHTLIRKNETIKQKLNEVNKLKDHNQNLIKRYKYAVEGSKSGIWDWDLIKNEVYFDRNWKKMLGYEENEIKSNLEEWSKRVHPSDIKKATKDIMNNQIRKTSYYHNIHRLKHKDGSWIWTLDRGKTYFDNNGSPTRMVGFHTNITELKELEIKLKENQENLIIAQEIAQIGYWRYNVTRKTFFVSEALCKLLNINNSSSIESYEYFTQFIHEDDKQYYTKEHKNIFEKKAKKNLQYRFINKETNEIMKINETISFVYNDVLDEENIISTIQDVTIIKKAEEELVLFKKIIDKSPISIIITDTDANIIYVNNYFEITTGYEEKEIIGKNPRMLKSENTDVNDYIKMWEELSQKKTWGGIFKNIRKDGSEYWETAMITPIVDENDEIINYLAIKREITKEVYLKKELKEKEELMLMQSKNAAMGEMISMIAHQWRQPITTISMVANNILAEVELDMFRESSAIEFATEISRQTQYLSKTIDDFRNFFKEDKETEESTLGKLFEGIHSIIDASLKSHNIEMYVSYNEEIVFKTYTRELLQVIINMIKNSKEALEDLKKDKKYINVNIYDEEENINIKISDNAGGIKEEILEKIFDPYFTTKEEQNGTGLGLYMSKMIVEKHLQGSLSVQNITEGAEFTLRIKKRI